jgi:GDSL-like Lipase/Acylhydrolase family
VGHVVLLGDSIFDNARYVPDRPPVIDQLRHVLPAGWRATLLAVDGHITEDIATQLRNLPADATHLFVSAGGNDALGESNVLGEAAVTVGEALAIMYDVRERFRQSYRAMLGALSAMRRPVAVCTVYDAIPGLGPAERVALAGFNETILREAIQAGLPVVDLRLLCDQPSDFSHLTPIEPSHLGGAKIVRMIAEIATTHDFGSRRSVIYA